MGQIHLYQFIQHCRCLFPGKSLVANWLCNLWSVGKAIMLVEYHANKPTRYNVFDEISYFIAKLIVSFETSRRLLRRFDILNLRHIKKKIMEIRWRKRTLPRNSMLFLRYFPVSTDNFFEWYRLLLRVNWIRIVLIEFRNQACTITLYGCIRGERMHRARVNGRLK